MSPQSKSPAVTPPDGQRSGLYRVAIVGATSLKGKEVAEVLGDRNFPSLDIKLLDDDESMGQLETVAGEISFVQGTSAEQFDHVDFTFFASSREFTRNNWKRVREAGSSIVDLSYALEDEPDALVRSPWIERQLAQARPLELQPGPSVVAHPASTVLALLLLRMQQAAKLKSVTATIFEPVSEHGQKGMDELHEQTVNLLSFQPLPKSIFDTQVAFNMVVRYGEQAARPLASIEKRVLKHYQRIAGKEQPVPALLVVQAPVFHGYAFALHFELESPAEITALSKALAGEHVTIVRAGEEAPNNVGASGQDDIMIAILPDSNHPNGVWLWAAADNLRIAATTAVECAETMSASRPRGKIQ
jgi:aspartate-semialdehyde dehydrogenase